MRKILIVNGPNLNKLGTREKSIYGTQTFDSYLNELKDRFPGVSLSYFQSNHEGELIDTLHNASDIDLIVMNPGGLSHTSVALADAISSISIPVMEVHISNVHAREEFRKTLITATSSVGVITGFGLDGYRMAIAHFLKS